MNPEPPPPQRVPTLTEVVRDVPHVDTPAPAEATLRVDSDLATAGLITIASTSAPAQPYPLRPIRMVIPYTPGGPTDLVGRLLAQRLQDALGQQVVVDNRGGAGGNIGAALAAKAPADGHTLFMGTVGTHGINRALYAKLPYDPFKDFAPITLVAGLLADPMQ